MPQRMSGVLVVAVSITYDIAMEVGRPPGGTDGESRRCVDNYYSEEVTFQLPRSENTRERI